MDHAETQATGLVEGFTWNCQVGRLVRSLDLNWSVCYFEVRSLLDLR